MLIVCPACDTPYQVENSILGAAGRSVRCVRCRHVWRTVGPPGTPEPDAKPALASADDAASDEAVTAFKAELSDDPPPKPEAASEVMTDAPAEPAEPTEPASAEAPADADPALRGPSLDELIASNTPDAPAPDAESPASVEAPAPAPANEPEPQPLSLSDISIPTSGAPPLAPEDAADTVTLQNAREDIESAAGRRRAARARDRADTARTWRNGLPLAILALVAAVAALLGWRSAIVRQLPQTASFYETLLMPVNLRGLKFADVKLAKDTHDGVPVLVVEGQIVSVATVPVDVPRLRLAVRNAAGGEVYAWTAVPPQTTLAPGETLAFRSRLAAPPDDARDVLVRFFSRRDAVAGLR